MDAKQQIPLELPSKPQQQTVAKPDAVTTALISVFEIRVIDILPHLGFLFLTYNVVEALSKANGDYGTISSVICSHANLIALFCCLKSLHKESNRPSNYHLQTGTTCQQKLTSNCKRIQLTGPAVFDNVPPVNEELTAPTSQPQDEPIKGRGRRGGFATEIKNRSGGATRRVALFLLATSLALFISSPTGSKNPTYVDVVRNLFNVMAFFSSVVLAIFTVYNQ